MHRNSGQYRSHHCEISFWLGFWKGTMMKQTTKEAVSMNVVYIRIIPSFMTLGRFRPRKACNAHISWITASTIITVVVQMRFARLLSF